MTDKDDTGLLHPRDPWLAAVLLTRVPLPKLPQSAFQRSAGATWAYPVVGIALGLAASCIWAIAGAAGLTPALQAGLALASLVVLTGGLHEDGLADTADGLWGGHDADRRLAIMKDSRIGSFGVLALLFCIVLKWLALTEAGLVALLVAATLSRAVLPALMTLGPYARPDGLARSVGTPRHVTAYIALILGAGAALIGLGGTAGLAAILVVAGIGLGLRYLAVRKIGGLTGDILGATQNMAELGVLLVAAALLA